MKAGTFGMQEAARLTGLPEYSLNNWYQRGLIRPSANLGAGRGRGKRWTLQDLVGLRVIRELQEQGVSLQRVRKVADKLQSLKGKKGSLDALAASRLVVVGGEVAICSRDRSVELASGQQLFFAVDLEGHVAEIREGLRKAGIEEAA